MKIICPICDGAGIDLDYFLLYGKEISCHNCFGTGYVEYPDCPANNHPTDEPAN